LCLVDCIRDYAIFESGLTDWMDEMNKLEKLAEVVHAFSGKWPHPECVYMGEFLSRKTFSTNNYGDDSVCTKSDFYAAAKELGYVNGYRWGVEYNNQGNEPLISNDVLIEVYSTADERWNAGPCSIWNFKARTITAFKITDPRFKPADTSYLDKADISLDNGNNYNEGAEHFEWIANQFDNVDDANAVWALRDKLFHSRKAKAERKRVVDAAFDSCIQKGCGNFEEWLDHLYGEGFLRMPESQK
jgi:hypothetical protein